MVLNTTALYLYLHDIVCKANLQKFLPDLAASLFSENSIFKMSDKAALNLLNPKLIELLVEQDLFHLSFYYILIAPLFIPFTDAKSECSVKMTTFALYCCIRYYNYIDDISKYADNVQMMKPK